MKQGKLTDLVRQILRENENARNNDTYLTALVIHRRMPQCYQIIDGKAWIAYEAIKIYREDHVKRVRAKIQNDEGKYLPTDPEVRKQRKISEEEWLSWTRESKLGGNPSFT